MDNNNTLVFRQNNGCKDAFKMMSNALYWHIKVIKMTHEKSSFRAIHKVENNYCSGFFGVKNEGLQLELSVDFVSFNRYTCRIRDLKHPVYNTLYKSFNLMFEISLRQRFCWPMKKTGFCWILEYFKRPVSHHHFFKLLSVHPLLSCPRQPSTLYLFCQYAGYFMGTLKNFRKSSHTSKQEINTIKVGTKSFA